jgi:chaperonin cofactor prefoldin
VDNDVEMEDSDVSENPPTSTAATQAQSPSRTGSPTAVTDFASNAEERDVELESLKEKVDEIEERMGKVTEDIRERVLALEWRTFEDNADLADLRWRTAELEGTSGKDRLASGERKPNVKGGNRTRHRYNTRSSMGWGDDPVEFNQQAYRDVKEKAKRLEGKAKRLEEKIERQEQEQERMKGMLKEVESLMPKVTELRTSFESFQIHQTKVNLATSLAITRLRDHFVSDFDSRFGIHTREIALLTARYKTLFEVAASLVAQRYADNQNSLGNSNSVTRYPISTISTKAAPPPSYYGPFSTQSFSPFNKTNQLPPIRRIAAL